MPENTAANDTSGASSPGTILKRCREYHGASIEEAAESTKIAVHHLRALENDQIREFASLIYLKGFLRIYAGFLGLNPDDLMRLYERLDPGAEDSEHDRGQTTGEDSKRKRRRFSWQRLALPTVLLLAMFVTSAILNHSSHPSRPVTQLHPAFTSTSAPAVQPVRSSAQAVTATPEPEAEPEQDHTQEAEEAVVAPKDTAPKVNETFIVRLKVVQSGSLSVTIDGSTSQSYDLASGDVFEWKADRSVALELSNAASVEAELNGRPLRHFGPSGAPAYVVLDANGLKQ